ncbi:transposase domain-containing protein, partial [Rhodococcus erythropolis]
MRSHGAAKSNIEGAGDRILFDRDGLDRGSSHEEVFEQLADGLSWSSGWSKNWTAPTKSAIFQAHSRLGYEPIQKLFRRVPCPLAAAYAPGSRLAGRQWVAIDGTYRNLPTAPANDDCLGWPASSRGEQS